MGRAAADTLAADLRHLALPVPDETKSRRFYETFFGFDPALARRHEDGVLMLRNAAGFHLALLESREAIPLPDFFHFGFRVDEPDLVRKALRELEAEGVQIVERNDEPGYVSFKCLDPAGYRVEVSWEA